MVQAGDSTTTQQAVTAGQGIYQGGLAAAAQATAGLHSQYGVVPLADGQAAPPGSRVVKDPATGRSFAIDVAGNPYSLAAQLQDTFMRRRRGELSTAGAGGHQYDSSFGEQRQFTDKAEGQGWVDFGQGLSKGTLEIEKGKQDAYGEALSLIFPNRQADRDRAAETPQPNAAPGGAPAATADAEKWVGPFGLAQATGFMPYKPKPKKAKKKGKR